MAMGSDNLTRSRPAGPVGGPPARACRSISPPARINQRFRTSENRDGGWGYVAVLAP